MNAEIKISKQPVNYKEAMEFLENRVKNIQDSKKKNLLWILEHPNMYTFGTSAKKEDLLNPNKLPIFKSSRGGQWTFHGNGQKIIYFVYKLKEKNIKKFIRNIEHFIINILSDHSIDSFNDKKNIGIWVQNNNKINKIAAIGIRIKKWIAFHGFSLNVNVNKDNYNGIIPCGIQNRGIANMTDFIDISKIKGLNENIISNYKKIFE